jgi:hypothetical protein
MIAARVTFGQALLVAKRNPQLLEISQHCALVRVLGGL